jgi:2'-5' RNA ligase
MPHVNSINLHLSYDIKKYIYDHTLHLHESIKPIPFDKLHITLIFLDKFINNKSRREQINNIVNKYNNLNIILIFDKLDIFSHKNNVLVIKFKQNNKVTQIYNEICNELHIDKTIIIPHITLGKIINKYINYDSVDIDDIHIN